MQQSEKITLPDQAFSSVEGNIVLSHLNTDWLILYFYPKDATPGCTTQAVGFSCLLDDFNEHQATVIGISRDSLKTHQNFTNKHNLKINLMSDQDEALCQHFDVIKEKNMYGKKVMGIERSTFIFYKGELVQSYRKVKAAGHAEQVLTDLKRIQSEII